MSRRLRGRWRGIRLAAGSRGLDGNAMLGEERDGALPVERLGRDR